MIDSCLERNRKTIILDKVMVNADTPSQHLALVSEDIKAHTITHFQSIAIDSQSSLKKQNIFVACTGCTFHEESQCARLFIATQWLFCGNLIDIDLSQLIQTNYFTS
ncbi:5929_t:CDS:2, partial [Funneliformis geosporum]